MENLSAEDHAMVIEKYNLTKDDTTLGHTLNQLLEEAAQKYEANTAVICADVELSYGTLNNLANRFARHLVGQGIGRGDLVGVALERSVDLWIVLLAVLKSGAAYVPLDPAFPADRIKHILNNANPKLAIVSSATSNSLTAWAGTVLDIEQLWTSNGNENNLNLNIRKSDLAYVIYTSGSTGRPKGVEIPHEALSNTLLSLQRVTGCDETTRLLAITTVSFDMSVLEIFLPLLCGATIVIAQQHENKSVDSLYVLIRRYAISMMQGTPATWRMLLDYGWPDDVQQLTKILVGGEAVSRQLADRLLAICHYGSVWNVYGPTEATVWASSWKLQPGEAVSIGKPLANYQLYVLDESRVPVSLGSIGELYIGGSSLARGYHDNLDLTRSCFVENPFHGNLMYRTGDLACWSATGELAVLGRVDSQIKVRGYRIELGDIESAIMEHEAISHCVVIYRDERLVAYCKREMSGDSGVAKLALSKLLRQWLSERLPSYMVPAFFVELSTFPLSPSGKVDRKALPDPTADLQYHKKINLVTETERHVFDIWKDVLGHEQFDVDDNFFQVGGDSVSLVRVQVELEKLVSRPVLAAKLFEHFTIKTLAIYLVTMDKAKIQLEAEPNRSRPRTFSDDEDIAIVSMSCRLPGGITTPEEYWELLVNGGDAISDVPKDRWDADALYSADPSSPGKSHCRQGGFISPIDAFDASFFGISPREANAMDPTQYLTLEACWEVFERAGYTSERLRGSQTGVYIGISNFAHQDNACARDYADLDGYASSGTASSTTSGRVSYVLGLEGPNLTVDTACSSSLVATHLACAALRRGECDMAVAGGITLMLTPGLHIEFSRLGGMSPDGRCRAFSADAQGTGWADGVATVMLKRRLDAERDGDTIHALLRGSAVNHGGRSASLTTPSGPAQERLLRSALAAAGVRPADIDYVEAHGTATRLGDPIEAAALAGVFQASRPASVEPLWIGSAKSNIGHTQAAAGLAGLLKVVLAMRHQMLPPTLHASKPTPLIDWQAANMALVQQNQPWVSQSHRPRRAGISAFGIGGTNAHAIVEEAPEQIRHAYGTQKKASVHPLLPLVISGQSDAALNQQVRNLHLQLRSNIGAHRIGDVAFSLATTRNHFRRRLVLMAQNETELLRQLVAIPTNAVRTPDAYSKEPPLAMLFTGQGSQWPGMGKDLARQFPIFQKALDEIVSQFGSILERPLLDVMWAQDSSEPAALLERTDYAQCAIFSLEVALWSLWNSWGVQPKLVLGHSVGELAAAHIAGVFNLADACRMVAARASLMHALPGRGKMVSIEASATDVEDAIGKLGFSHQIDIASLNTPTQTVISGDVDALQALTAHFSGRGRKTKALAVSHAFHSHHMDDMLADFLAVVKTVNFNPPTAGFISSVTGKPAEVGQIETAAYWVKQARQPVRFSDSIQTLIGEGIECFIELGPRPVLCGLGAMCIVDGNKADSTAWLPSLAPGRDAIEVIQSSLANLHVRHVPIDWAGYFKPFGYHRVDLPTYAFQRERFMQKGPRDSATFHHTFPTQNHSAADPVKSEVEHYEFGINWDRWVADSNYIDGVWGIILPVEEVAWVKEVKLALLAAGARLHEVSNVENAKGLDGLLCLWNSDDDLLRQTRNYTEVALTQLQDAVETAFLPPITWITRNAVGTGHDNQIDGLGGSVLWGLMRTARSEHPELNLRLLDLDKKELNAKALASCLMAGDWNECAFRNGQVFVPRMVHIESSQQGEQLLSRSLIRRDGAVLITGGTGGIGQSVARWLVKSHSVRDLVLISRRGMNAPDAEKFVHELASLGAKAVIAPCDIAEINDVKNIMTAFHKDRPLRGVIHTAGVIDDGVLSALTPRRCDTTFRPKSDGAWHLHELTKSMDLDIFVMFSSISGITGTAGQGNYAAANTFLDALAYLRRAENLPATSIAWGLWSGNGMGSNLSETGHIRYANVGLHGLTPERGLKILEQSVCSGRALTVGAAYDVGRLRDYYDERQERPHLLLSLLGPHTESKKMGPIASGGEDHALHARLRNARIADQAPIVLAMVRETVATTLGFASSDDVNVHLRLQDIGIDSLTAVLIRGRLANLTGLTLSPKIVFDYPNLTALSQFLLSRMQESVEGSSSDGDSGSSTSLSSVELEGPVLNMSAIRQGCLDAKLTFENSAIYAHAARPKSVLVTGGTGFVGSFITQKLLELGVETYCLVRAVSTEHARTRLVTSLSDYGLWQPRYTSLLKPVVGDMEKPLLGLENDTFDQLADHVDAICHSSALVDWMRPLEDYVKPNIVSTHEVIRLASQGRVKTVHVISTVATLPKYFGHEISEDEREYGYATSKWTSEQMVIAARWRGLGCSIYRLPFVTASASTGHFRRDRGDFMHNLIAGSIDLGWFPELNVDLSAVLPVDYLASTIVTVMTQDLARLGQDFDFLDVKAPDLATFSRLLSAASGGRGILPFAEWRREALDYAATHPTSSLARISAVIDILTEDAAIAMIKASAVGKNVFGGDYYPAPPVDDGYAQKYANRIAASLNVG
jgi:amino acid adenylation domain-containing protein/thioester reductase-like protein